MGNEIQKHEPVSPLATAAQLCQTNEGMDVAKLKELLELQERWDANQAKKAYVQAMAKFKKKPPEIFKDKAVSYGQTEYSHASLHNVTVTINSELSKHGLTASWQTSQDNGSVQVTCKITHVLGHSEETRLSAAPDVSGSKNPIQAIGSTVTYLQRYTLLALTGLATADQDDDGKGADTKPQLPKMTAKNKQVLKGICEKLKETIEPDRIIDEEKVAKLLYSQNRNNYPNKLENAAVAAAEIIGLQQEDSWTKGATGKKQAGPKVPTKEEQEVLDSICATLLETLEDGEIVDEPKVAAVFFAKKGRYPSDKKIAGTVAAWLISLNVKNSWVKKGK